MLDHRPGISFRKEARFCLKAGTLLCSSLVVMAMADAAHAQSAAGPAEPAASSEVESAGVQDIVVTAQKRAERINSVGISINAFSGADLAKTGVQSAADLVKIVPGFNYTPSAYGAPVFTLRGIGFYDTSLGAAPTVAVYTDEVPLPYSTMASGVALDVERVEVLKGPQGTLFGANTTGGAINYIVAKPTRNFATGVDATYGRFDEITLNGFVSGPLSDALRVRLSARTEQRGDWQRSYTRDDSIGRRDFTVARFLADWTPTGRFSATIDVDGWMDRSDNQAQQLIGIIPNRISKPAVVNAPLSPLDARSADWDPLTEFSRHNDYYRLSARMNYELSDSATITSITAYQHLKRQSYTDADGMAIPEFAIGTPGRISSFFQELRVSGDLSDRVKYILGGNYKRDKIHDEIYSYYPYSYFAFSSALTALDQRVLSLAAFANLDVKLTDKLTLQGGARYTDERRSLAACLYDSGNGELARYVSGIATARSGQVVTILPGACSTLNAQYLPAIVHDTLNQDNLSWRINLNWQQSPATLLYANISRGYKSGVFPTIGGTFAAQYAPAVQETVLAYEAGFKLGLFDRKLQLNGAAFYYDYGNKQLRGRRVDPILGPVQGMLNIPTSRIVGAELQATVRPVPDLTFNIGGTYINSKIIGSFVSYDYRARSVEFGGQSFPLTPRWQLTSSGDFEPALTPSLRGILGYTVTYQSATQAGLGNDPVLRIDKYALVDLRAGVAWGDNARWRATAFVRNLTDKYYWTYVNAGGVEAITRLTGMPRTYGVTLAVRFGD